MVKRTYKKRYSRKYYKRVPRTVKAYVAKTLDKMVEDKEVIYDMETTYASVGSTWQELTLFRMATGTTASTRIGNKIRVKSIEINAVMAAGASGTAADDPYNIMRVVLGLYQGNGTAPLASGTATLNTPIRSDAYTGTRMIRKYLDKYIPLQCTTVENGPGDGYAPGVKQLKYYKRFKRPVLIDFASEGDTTFNQMFILSMISDSTVIPNPGCVAGYMSCKYEDA